MMTSKKFIISGRFLQYLALIIGFSVLVLIQTSVLGHFSIYGTKLNLIFIAVFLLSFFESPNNELGKVSVGIAVPAGVIGGFLLDIFSSLPFGTFTITFLILAVLIKRFNVFLHKSNKAAFLIAFFLAFVFYKICFAILAMVLALVFQGQFFFIWPIKLTALIELVYNFMITGLIYSFYILRKR